MKNNAPLILLVAKSGAGKNYFTNQMKEAYQLEEVISRTTRQPRYEGEDTHLFVSMTQAKNEITQSLASTYFNKNFYYVLEEDLQGKAFYIIDTVGVQTFQEKNYDQPYVVVYYNVPAITRFFRMLKRGDGLRASIRRILHDRKAFDGIEELATYQCKSHKELTEVVKNILKTNNNDIVKMTRE